MMDYRLSGWKINNDRNNYWCIVPNYDNQDNQILRFAFVAVNRSKAQNEQKSGFWR
mgnify:CR=1 FL=1